MGGAVELFLSREAHSVHERQGGPDAYNVWLDPAIRDVEAVQALLTPYPAEEMVAYPASPRVNNPAYDTPECVAPLT
jgi:putative SOS response-associated peptidase YedK